MSVWPKTGPASLSLPGSEGELVSVSIQIAPRDLESLLEVLAAIEFPINPQIYHDAAPGTVVEFPAYENHLSEVYTALQASGFPADCLRVTPMLQVIQAARA
ncbi:MAG TPA: hypothetical protein VG273_04250 [Bryobacteraceae bacterium]|jgi:hypothetical protein|nr:hypothetical protein [Bryobacteraceae bacterium]